MIKVLLADDHSIVRAGLRRIVEESGQMEVIAEAADGREAIDQVHKALPDVAVIDISMPGLDGLATGRTLREMSPALPVILMSGYLDQEFTSQLAEMGLSAFIRKPFKTQDLARKLQEVLVSGS